MRKILLLLLMLLPMVASAHDFEVDGFFYKILNDNKVAVTYEGYSYYAYEDEYSGEVVIPESVTYNGITYSVISINERTFYQCSLIKIHVPSSITYIGSGAFDGCRLLTTIDIPSSVSFIGSSAFSGCTGLTSFEIPSGISSIEVGTFSECSGLTGISIPNTVTSIGNGAFANCTSLRDIEIPNSVSSIGSGAFQHCNGLTSIKIPNSVISIGDHAFNSCLSLTSIEIPNSITSIGNYIFAYCTSLRSVIIPNSVTSIGCQAFISCGLISVDIPSSVAFIGDEAFAGCSSLTNINIPNSVTSIGNSAFSGCRGLTRITVESDNQNYDSRNNCNAIIETASNTLMIGCKNTIIPNSITNIGNEAFYSCTGLNYIEIPNSIISINYRAFSSCVNLISIQIPNSVTTIGNEAFDGCTGLTSITIPNSVLTIGDAAFRGCSGLSSIEIPNSIINIGEGAFVTWNNLESLIVTGEGEGRGSAINCSTSYLYIDSRITSIKGLKINPKYNVYSYATAPPICDANTFTSYSSTLHVPATSLAAYFTAEYWSNFTNIVGDAVEPEEVKTNQDRIEVSLGNQISLTATVTPSNATPNNVSWRTTNTSIATVYNGVVSAIGVGECDIIAECLNRRDSCHVVVNDTTVTISLDQQEASVLPNHIITLTPSASPVMPDLTVSSSDPSVAAARLVNNKIQVVGIKEGTTTITVGSVDGSAIPATCLVTVYTEPGDINCDGFVNISDVTSLIDYLLSGDNSQISTKNADVNDDGSINISDVTTLIDTLLSGNG